MTLLDAPAYDEAREKRRSVILYSAAGLLFVLFVGWWLVAGRPVDWPWNWNNHLLGRMTVNAFFTALEKNDLPAAYGIWIHDKNWQQHLAEFNSYSYDRFLADRGYKGKRETLDKNLAKKLAEEYGQSLHDKDWQQHQAQYTHYSFERFEKDWSPDSRDNDYGQIHSHRIAAARMIGNVLQTGTFVNERKSKAINLDYDPEDHTLTFSPEDVQFLEGPGGIS